MGKNSTRLLIVSIFLLFPLFSWAQDIIIKHSGDEISAKVEEIEDQKIKYRRFDNLEGPIYNIAKSEVFMIRYKNGTKEVFKNAGTQPVAAASEPAPAPKPAPASVAVPAPETANAAAIAQMLAAKPANPAPSAAKPPVAAKTYSRTSKFYLAYSPGAFAPLGISMGSISNGGGFILSARVSGNSFGDVSIYEMSDAEGISDDYWTWNYTGETEYRRGAFTLAYVSRIAGNLDGTSFHAYAGLGYGYANYFYIYEQTGKSGNSYGNELIKYTDVSKSSVEYEAGFILDMSSFNLNLGYTTTGFSEPMITFGVGVGL